MKVSDVRGHRRLTLSVCPLQDQWTQEKADTQENLEYQFRENLMEMGKSHREAANQVNEQVRRARRLATVACVCRRSVSPTTNING
jgi:hypothetical protein